MSTDVHEIPDIPTLETPRLWLRGLKFADAPRMQNLVNHWEIARYLAGGFPWPYPEDGAVTFLKNGVMDSQGIDNWAWGLFLKNPTTPNDEGVIGVISLRKKNPEGNRGFWLGLPYHGQGLMTEASEAVNRFAFEVVGFDKLILRNAVKNNASSRIKQKNGAILIRIEPSKSVDPTLTESEVWELTRDAWISAHR